jgi:hypothetical protein
MPLGNGSRYQRQAHGIRVSPLDTFRLQERVWLGGYNAIQFLRHYPVHSPRYLATRSSCSSTVTWVNTTPSPSYQRPACPRSRVTQQFHRGRDLETAPRLGSWESDTITSPKRIADGELSTRNLASYSSFDVCDNRISPIPALNTQKILPMARYQPKLTCLDDCVPSSSLPQM